MNNFFCLFYFRRIKMAIALFCHLRSISITPDGNFEFHTITYKINERTKIPNLNVR